MSAPTYSRGGWPDGSTMFCRGVGCEYEPGYVRVLHAPDQGDHCRLMFRLTAAAAEDLAEELLRCAGWAREAAGTERVVRP